MIAAPVGTWVLVFSFVVWFVDALAREWKMKTDDVQRDLIYDGWGKFYVLHLTSKDGTTYTRQVDDHGDAVCVLPYDPVRKVATVIRQTRAGPLFMNETESILELPAGRLETGMSHEQCARAETIEETGIRLRDLELISTFWTAPSVSTERITLFLAIYNEADRVSAGGGLHHEQEEIEVIELPISELVRMADQDALPDLKTYAAVQTLRLRRPDIIL